MIDGNFCYRCDVGGDPHQLCSTCLTEIEPMSALADRIERHLGHPGASYRIAEDGREIPTVFWCDGEIDYYDMERVVAYIRDTSSS